MDFQLDDMVNLAHAIKEVTGATDPSEIREAVEAFRDEGNDFTVRLDGYDWRFMVQEDAAEIMAQELGWDTYCLGCYRDTFISEVTGWPLALIQAAQKGEAYDEIRQALVDGGHVQAMAEGLIKYDGAGHHFSSYDGETREIRPRYVDEGGKVAFLDFYAFNCG